MQKRQNLLAFGLLFPSILVLGTFVFYPMIKTFWLSTQTTDLMGNPIKSVGFKNFTNLFNSEIFRTSITVTLIFVLVTTVVTVVLAYWLAILASSKLKVIGFFRTIFQRRWEFR